MEARQTSQKLKYRLTKKISELYIPKLLLTATPSRPQHTKCDSETPDSDFRTLLR